MSIETTPARRRRTAQDARADAVAAARQILLAEGPAAITLKAVAKMLGMSHANLLHHFGSAGGLQLALMTSMVADLSAALQGAVDSVTNGLAPPESLVDIVFEAFDEGGAGRLAAWLVLTGATEQLQPIREQIEALVAALQKPIVPLGPEAVDGVRLRVLNVTYQAFADALLGGLLHEMLGLPADAALALTKKSALESLAGGSIEYAWPPGLNFLKVGAFPRSWRLANLALGKASI